jgi:hypothetical protein
MRKGGNHVGKYKQKRTEQRPHEEYLQKKQKVRAKGKNHKREWGQTATKTEGKTERPK